MKKRLVKQSSLLVFLSMICIASICSIAFIGCTTADVSSTIGSNYIGSNADYKIFSDGWDLSVVDTARNVNYLSDVEKDVILELNKARTNPARYAELYIAPRTKKFLGTIYNGTLKTNEGVSAVNECVEVMGKASAVSALTPQEGLSLAAQDHAYSQGDTDQVGHIGVDGSNPSERIEKYGTYKTAGENICYGQVTGQEIVVQLLIDDGVSNRGHRENILKADYTSAGCGFARKHKTYGSVCVTTFAGGYKEK